MAEVQRAFMNFNFLIRTPLAADLQSAALPPDYKSGGSGQGYVGIIL